jgi:hypothetical protein
LAWGKCRGCSEWVDRFTSPQIMCVCLPHCLLRFGALSSLPSPSMLFPQVVRDLNDGDCDADGSGVGAPREGAPRLQRRGGSGSGSGGGSGCGLEVGVDGGMLPPGCGVGNADLPVGGGDGASSGTVGASPGRGGPRAPGVRAHDGAVLVDVQSGPAHHAHQRNVSFADSTRTANTSVVSKDITIDVSPVDGGRASEVRMKCGCGGCVLLVYVL